MNTPAGAEERAAAAYEWAANLIGLARRLIADGVETDLAPIRPAIRDLCAVVKELPRAEANDWITHLLDLQHELAALGHDLAARGESPDAPAPSGEGPEQCR